MINWHIGCSGFYYKHWKGLFYPNDLPQKKWFDYYCNYFNTLELNVTFYRFPQVSFLETWYKKSPEEFTFAVKAPRAITHYKKFTGTTDMISDFYNTIRQGLKQKLGCVLFQLPPSLVYTEERLDKITSSLDNSFINVLEFRHASWWNKNVYDRLAVQKISFCGMSHPTLPADIICNTPYLYYRMHGDQQLYASAYSAKQLQDIAADITTQKHVKEVFIYFNNDIHAHATKNAIELKAITSDTTLS